MEYNFVMLDIGSRALLRERDAIAALKRFGEQLNDPFVQYIGQARIVQGVNAGAAVHAVRLSGGTVLCYLQGCKDESKV